MGDALSWFTAWAELAKHNYAQNSHAARSSATATHYGPLISNVFWLDGSSKDSVYQSLAYCAKRVLRAANPGIDTPTVDVESLSSYFISWLAEEGNEDWMIVVDNLDCDWRRGNDQLAFDYTEILPDADHGNVIITTRLADLESPNASLHLDRLDEGQARSLIEACAGRSLEGK